MKKENEQGATEVQKNYIKRTDPIIHNLTRDSNKASSLLKEKESSNATISKAWAEAVIEVGNETIALLDEYKKTLKNIGSENYRDVFEHAEMSLNPSDELLNLKFSVMQIAQPNRLIDIQDKSKKLVSIIQRMTENGIAEGLQNIKINSKLSE